MVKSILQTTFNASAFHDLPLFEKCLYLKKAANKARLRPKMKLL